MKSKLLLGILLLLLIFVGLELFVFSAKSTTPPNSTATNPSTNSSPTVDLIPPQGMLSIFTGRLQTITQSRTGTSAVIQVTQPNGIVKSQNFLLLPSDNKLMFALHNSITSDNKVSVEAQYFNSKTIDTGLAPFKGKPIQWITVLRQPQGHEIALGEYAQTSLDYPQYLACNQSFATKLQTNALPETTCTPLVDIAVEQ